MEESIKGLGQMQGRQTGGWGRNPPRIFKGGGVECLSNPLILRGFFLIAHICYYVQVISIWGGGVDSP